MTEGANSPTEKQEKEHAFCDYLTLTTPTMQNWLTVMQLIHERFSRVNSRQARRMQFNGRTFHNGDIFCGEGNINGQRWHMLQISGAVSHEVLGIVANEGVPMRCTRLDLQVTRLIQLESYRPRDIYDACNTDSKLLILNDSDETSTIYLGQRTSRKYARLYVKRLYQDYLRLEYEFKRDYSRVIFQNILDKGQEVVDQIYQGALDKSKFPEQIRKDFSIGCQGIKPSQLTPLEELKATDSYFLYLENVKKSLIKSLSDDTRAGQAAEWIRNMSAILDNHVL